MALSYMMTEILCDCNISSRILKSRNTSEKYFKLLPLMVPQFGTNYLMFVLLPLLPVLDNLPKMLSLRLSPHSLNFYLLSTRLYNMITKFDSGVLSYAPVPPKD